MHTLRRVTAPLLFALTTAALPAQTYLGNGAHVLDGFGNAASVFETGTAVSLPTLSWTKLTGVNVQVWDVSTNGVILDIGGGGYGNFAAQFVTTSSLVANSLYTFTADMGYVAGSGLPGIATYQMEIGTWNGTSFNQLAVDSGIVNSTGNIGTSSANSIEGTVTFTTGASLPNSDMIAIRWWGANGGSVGVNADFLGFDNVALSVTAIPEPSTYALLFGLGALGFAARRRLGRLVLSMARGRILSGLALVAGLTQVPVESRAQTVLLDEDFENPTIEGIPTGWTKFAGNYDDTTVNPNPSGINTSAKVLIGDTLTTTRVASPVMDISGLTGATFTLEFDLYNPSLTNNHGLIIGYGPSGVVDVWALASSAASVPLGGGQTIFNLDAPATWQHFTIDITSRVNAYAGNPALFTLSFQDWGDITAVKSSLDNVVLTATAIPEPSTYAAIFGCVALAGAMLHRRRRQTL